MTSELPRKAPSPKAGEGRDGRPHSSRGWWVAILAALGVGGIGAVAAMVLMRDPGPGGEMGGSAQGKIQPAPIDGGRAYGYLKQICALGRRPAGSEANTRQRELVAAHFKKHGGSVREQTFKGRDPLSGQPVQMANLIGSWFPERTQRVVIAAHYDTRPFADREPDPMRRNDPFLGANDGASGVALLMEIAHHLGDSPTEWGVDLVLFDGEELVYDRTGEYFLGSKEFARQYKAGRRTGREKSFYAAGILLDMVGGIDLTIEQEVNSMQRAGGLVRSVWAVARELGATAFRDEPGPEVLDDHIAMNEAGIPTIDIIDFEYAFWHTADDLPEKCSPKSLEEVGRVVTAWLSKPKPTRRAR